MDGAASAATIARAATPAHAQKAAVNPASVGTPCSVTLDAMMAAMTAVPMLLPTVRMTVFALMASLV